MEKLNIDEHKLRSDISKLKIVLIVHTIIQVGYFIIIFFNSDLWLSLNDSFKSDIVFGLLNFAVAGLIIWYNWKYLPFEKNKKWDKTWMIIFLGIIGMWLWIPNSKEISEMIKHDGSEQ